MKVGIIRCMQTEDYCPGTTDFRAIREKTGVFSDVPEPIELVGFTNCGGCPGKKSVLRARELVKRGGRYHRLCKLYPKGHTDWISLPICKKNERTDCNGLKWFRGTFRLYPLERVSYLSLKMKYPPL